MSKNKIRSIYTGLFLCLATAGLTACGSSDSEDADAGVMGRVTSVSDTQIVIEAFDRQRDDRPDGVSGSAIRENAGERPKAASGRAVDGEKPEGRRAEGTPPADGQQEGAGGKNRKAGESKTYTIDSDTKFYRRNGEEQTEVTLDDVELGGMVSITADGDTAVSITVQNMDSSNGGGRKGGTQGKSGQNNSDA